MTTTLITGANKGIGYETARQLIAAGHAVWADGGLDVLVNNAGVEGRTADNGIIGPAEETGKHMQELFETSVFGMVRVLHAI